MIIPSKQAINIAVRRLKAIDFVFNNMENSKMPRREKIAQNQIYHVFNKSIANFNIFTYEQNTLRFCQAFQYYNSVDLSKRYIKFSKLNESQKNQWDRNLLMKENVYSATKIIAYCLMPDHYHFLVKVINKDFFAKFIGNIENSYVRYFNLRINRKGPLWQSRFKNVLIGTNEQLLHATRYIHLNPTTQGLVNKPEEWEHSSYRSYISDKKYLAYLKEISINKPESYRIFCENRIDYQIKLKKIRKLLLE